MQERAANEASAASRQQADFHGNNVYGSCSGGHTPVAADLLGYLMSKGLMSIWVLLTAMTARIMLK